MHSFRSSICRCAVIISPIPFIYRSIHNPSPYKTRAIKAAPIKASPPLAMFAAAGLEEAVGNPDEAAEAVALLLVLVAIALVVLMVEIVAVKFEAPVTAEAVAETIALMVLLGAAEEVNAADDTAYALLALNCTVVVAIALPVALVSLEEESAIVNG